MEKPAFTCPSKCSSAAHCRRTDEIEGLLNMGILVQNEAVSLSPEGVLTAAIDAQVEREVIEQWTVLADSCQSLKNHMIKLNRS